MTRAPGLPCSPGAAPSLPVPDDDDVDLVLDKRAVSGTQARVGGTVRYELTVRNKGTDAASRAITVVDRLPAGLELVAARSNGWACTTRKAADTVSCVLRKDIGAGRKAAPVFVVTQPTRAATGRVANVARVRIAGESVRTNNTATAVVTVVPAQLPATGFRRLTWP